MGECAYMPMQIYLCRISIGILVHYFYRTGNSVIRKVVQP